MSYSAPDEISGVLPPGWALTTLDRLAQPYVEKIDPANAPSATYLGLEHVESGGTRRILAQGRARDVKSDKSVFHRGDILFGKLRPYLRKVVRPEFDGVCSTDFLVLKPTTAVQPEFLVLVLSSIEFATFTAAKTSGVNLPRVKWAQIANYPIALPPLAEQGRITGKLQALGEKNRVVRGQLEEIPTKLVQTRQALLTSAFTGELTADWRTSHNVKTTGASVVETASARRKSKAPPLLPSSAGGRAIPDSWEWASLDAITGLLTSGSRAWSRHYRSDGYGVFLLAQNVKPMRLDLSSVQRISPPSDDPDKIRSQVQKDDLLVTIVGAGVGQLCRVPGELPDHFVCQSVALIRPAIPEMGRYLEFFYNSETAGQAQLKDAMYGQGRPHLSFDGLKQTRVPVPPLPEQREIVKQLESAMASIERANQANNEALADLNRIDESLLTRAFRGELVLQEPADEPASILLERVHPKTIVIKMKTPRPKAGKIVETIPALLDKLPEKGFTFAELQEHSSVDYETLRDEVFAILGSPNPILKQVFDKDLRRIRFVRTRT